MEFLLGADAKLYYCEAGIGGTPTWTEMKNVKNLTLNIGHGEWDSTTRANQGWKSSEPTLKEASVEFDSVYDQTDTGFAAFWDAFIGKTLIGIAVMDGPVDTEGSQGLWADCKIITAPIDEPIDNGTTVKFTVKPCYSANPPQWKTIGT